MKTIEIITHYIIHIILRIIIVIALLSWLYIPAKAQDFTTVQNIKAFDSTNVVKKGGVLIGYLVEYRKSGFFAYKTNKEVFISYNEEWELIHIKKNVYMFPAKEEQSTSNK